MPAHDVQVDVQELRLDGPTEVCRWRLVRSLKYKITLARVNRNVHPSPTPTPSPTFACGDIAPLLLEWMGVLSDVVEINEVTDVVRASLDISIDVGVVGIALAGVKVILVAVNAPLDGLAVELPDVVVDDDDNDDDRVVVVVVKSFALLVILK
ncbi:hypothetical protein ANOM_003409 [Aspergillus nomiae NRRL 13137]|uniref:Uncharacterized protein n=1 Tax=Aspergillus nomiae NRRL (strain ATCC 15546 / NRRL 13137 / CBS 260.88 / M93) TaxID=1509407 RepID=A0A0L1J907_ASPN3|nr:uncharacterized protein ANOM_003409 [Aspergillus nomiae NRRL 13137]KNG87898.1 hypothetical protein ANOM_003409 [Aspergillus nomiae NRRL 13137]